MANAWAYTVAVAGVPMEQTFRLATEDGLIVRAFFANRQPPQALGNAQKLRPEDDLLLIYIDNGIIASALHCVLVDAENKPLSPLNTYRATDVHPDILRRLRTIPACFAVASDGTPQANTIEQAGYNDERRDPQIKEWVVLVVEVQEPIDDVPAEWQVWYKNLPNRMAPLRPFPDHLVPPREDIVVAELVD